MNIRKIAINALNFYEKIWLSPGRLGWGSFILPPYRIINPKGLFIGNNTRIGKYSFIGLIKMHNNIEYNPKIIIGNNISIGHDFFIGCIDKIIIEDYVLISSRVFIADAIHGYKDISNPIILQDLEGKPNQTIIKGGAFIGVNVSIMPGVTIGKNAVIAANSVVTKDIPPYTIAAGNPAIPIKKYSYEKKEWVRIS